MKKSRTGKRSFFLHHSYLKMLRVENINRELPHSGQINGKENCDKIYSHYKINIEKINLSTETELLSSIRKSSGDSDPERSIGDR
jgi:hypothetical protein